MNNFKDSARASKSPVWLYFPHAIRRLSSLQDSVKRLNEIYFTINFNDLVTYSLCTYCFEYETPKFSRQSKIVDVGRRAWRNVKYKQSENNEIRGTKRQENYFSRGSIWPVLDFRQTKIAILSVLRNSITLH